MLFLKGKGEGSSSPLRTTFTAFCLKNHGEAGCLLWLKWLTIGAIGRAQEESCCFERKMGWRDWRTLIKLGGVSKLVFVSSCWYVRLGKDTVNLKLSQQCFADLTQVPSPTLPHAFFLSLSLRAPKFFPIGWEGQLKFPCPC